LNAASDALQISCPNASAISLPQPASSARRQSGHGRQKGLPDRTSVARAAVDGRLEVDSDGLGPRCKGWPRDSRLSFGRDETILTLTLGTQQCVPATRSATSRSSAAKKRDVVEIPALDTVISEARVAVFGHHKPADVIVGVETLAEPGYLIEVEALAVVD
jgi:hypothetical protein